MLDPVPVRTLLAESVAAIGIEATWDDVVRPVMGAIAERWQHTGAGVEVEHQLSECVSGLFGQLAAGLVTDPDARPVLLAGMPGEQHMLPMAALSAALADLGVPCRPLGANLPVVALVAAIRRTAPSLVVLWAQASEVADVEALDSLPRTRPRFRLAVAGPGLGRPGVAGPDGAAGLAGRRASSHHRHGPGLRATATGRRPPGRLYAARSGSPVRTPRRKRLERCSRRNDRPAARRLAWRADDTPGRLR